MTPVLKKGSRLLPNNYRPVSLTCVLCKVMEKLVRENVVLHLQANSLISEKQHGFVDGRSCTTQLLDVLDKWTKVLDLGGSVNAITWTSKRPSTVCRINVCSVRSRPTESVAGCMGGSATF